MQIPHDTAGEAESCCDWQKNVDDFETRAQDFVRTEPGKAVGIAFIAGLILTILPVGRLVAAIVRLTFLLARPLLMILGAVKICEELEKRNRR